jgi:hypothetical protein
MAPMAMGASGSMATPGSRMMDKMADLMLSAWPVQ